MKTLGLDTRCFIVLLLLLAGCTVFGPEERYELVGQTTSTGIKLTNQSTDIVYHFVVGRDTAARIYWVPGFYEGGGLSPGGSQEIAFEDISKSEHESEVIVYWWYPIEEDGELRVSEVQWFILDL